MDEQSIKEIFAKKLAYYRKSLGLTQSQLAENLNYSDKSVSKWERGEGVPDIFVLSKIASLFQVRVDDLINEKAPVRPVDIKRNRRLISIISVGLVWFAAAIVFATLSVVGTTAFSPWLAFAFALPISSIVAIVFSSLWGGKTAIGISVSSLLWSTGICLVATFGWGKILFYFIALVLLQILLILFFNIKFKRAKPIEPTSEQQK